VDRDVARHLRGLVVVEGHEISGRDRDREVVQRGRVEKRVARRTGVRGARAVGAWRAVGTGRSVDVSAIAATTTAAPARRREDRDHHRGASHPDTVARQGTTAVLRASIVTGTEVVLPSSPTTSAVTFLPASSAIRATAGPFSDSLNFAPSLPSMKPNANATV